MCDADYGVAVGNAMTMGLNVAMGCTMMNLGVGVDVGNTKIKVLMGTISVIFTTGVRFTTGVLVGVLGVGVGGSVALGRMGVRVGVRVGGADVAAGSLVTVGTGVRTGAGEALATVFDVGPPPSAVGSDVTVARTPVAVADS